MNWYLAKIVFQIVIKGCLAPQQFDEQIRLISAATETEAIEKASIICKKEETCFASQEQQLIKWQFVNVCEVYCINEALDGGEIVSTLREVSSPDHYRQLINDKAAQLRKTAFCRQFNLN